MFLLVHSVGLAQHAGDVGVGVSAAGQLKCKPFDPNSVPCFDPSVAIATLTFYPASTSWRTSTPGFDANFGDDPAHDYYAMTNDNAVIDLVAHADMQSALRVNYQSQTIVHAGDYITLGSDILHRHPVFIVDANDPAYDPLQTMWSGTFTFRDDISGYAESAPFTIHLCVLNPNSFVVGDVDGDGTVGFGDINPFVMLLSNPTAATVQQRCEGDINLDGHVDFGDINPFVALLAGG